MAHCPPRQDLGSLRVTVEVRRRGREWVGLDWGYSSAGRALPLHGRSQRFESAYLHHLRVALGEGEEEVNNRAKGLSVGSGL